VEKVGDIIERNGFVSECVVSSLNFQALTEIKRAFPELKVGFIVLKAVGNLSRMDADFLSISAARATPRLVRAVHRRGEQVHVWTVNDLNYALSMIEMGVYNIITDEPKEIRNLLEAWQTLSDSEKIVLMLRNLIVGVERPEPSEL
jgi:glycerophosphoryl diester phosphodiesterase